jgi:uncharacterized protein (TIGR04222 family)
VNPFDWRGPEFLAFYAVFACVVIVVARMTRILVERDPRLTDRIADPYAIAFLRGGATEAARTAAVALAKRGSLVESDGKLVAAEGALNGTSDPLEIAVLEREGAGLADAETQVAYHVALNQRRGELERRGLIAGPAVRFRRWMLAAVVATALLGVAVTKIVIALGRGRTNVGFLVFLALVATVVGLLVAVTGRRTPLGARTLRHLRSILVGTRKRAEVRGRELDATELALLVAAFGAATPAGALPLAPALLFPRVRPKPSPGGDGGSWWLSTLGSSSSSSSCGSSSGSSCSSGCGGGGGGGGCGGCGSS